MHFDKDSNLKYEGKRQTKGRKKKETDAKRRKQPLLITYKPPPSLARTQTENRTHPVEQHESSKVNGKKELIRTKPLNQ